MKILADIWAETIIIYSMRGGDSFQNHVGILFLA